MGYRLSKIYTKTGDRGTTGLGDGARVDKDHPRVEAYGDVDELNSLMGVLACRDLPDEIRARLKTIQNELFDLGGELCIPGHSLLAAEMVARLESELDRLNRELEPLEEFILPGGTEAAAVCHLARAVCRRAERHVVALSRESEIGEFVIPYLNRLSDLLFVMARVLNSRAGVEDVCWKREQAESPKTKEPESD